MSHLIVVPSIHQPYTDACLASMSPATRAYTHVVDNTPPNVNRGVAGSWNVGRAVVIAWRLDWLVVCSAGIRFGERGGDDLTSILDGYPDPPVHHGEAPHLIEAADGLGWHLICFRRRVLERVGAFDERWLAYFEDNDWSYRYQLAYDRDSRAPEFVGPLWPKVPVDAHLAEVAHGIKRGDVSIDFVGGEAMFVEKWGGKSSEETYRHPYNDETLDWTYTGDPR